MARAVKARRVSDPELIVQVEHFHELDPQRPVGYQNFLSRMSVLHHEYDQWATVVTDSITFLDLALRRLNQHVLKPEPKFDLRHWGGASALAIEETVMQRFASLPMNVVVTAHVDEDKDEAHGKMLKHPSAPGKLPKRLPSAFGEFYHADTYDDAEGSVYYLQTRKDTLFNASSQIPAPNPCEPHYSALWNETEDEPFAVHCLVYGDSGAGKSTFAATFPKPMLVFLFDPPDKARPYLRQGSVGESYANDFGSLVVPVYGNLKAVA